MNWDHIQRNWTQFKGRAKEQWSKLGESQLHAIAGRRELLARRIHDAYGTSREETEKQIIAWQDSLGKPAHERS